MKLKTMATSVSAMGQEGGFWMPETRSQKTGKESKIESWWEVKRSDNPGDAKITRGATPLVERCMRVHGFSEEFARRVLKGYRQFMELKSVMNDWNELKLSPSLPINHMWELHLLDNLNYTEDCLLLFGRVIGHVPDAILDGTGLQARIQTTKIAFQARYGDDLDSDVWDFGDDWSPATMQSEQHIIKTSDPSVSLSHTPRGRLPVANGEAKVPSSPSVGTPSKSPGTPAAGNEPITIFLRDIATGEETYFSLRYKSTLRIVFTVFAERRGLNQDLLKFNFNGQQLTGYETPHSLGLDDRARIDVNIGSRS
jgi:hypothetical protein